MGWFYHQIFSAISNVAESLSLWDEVAVICDNVAWPQLQILEAICYAVTGCAHPILFALVHKQPHEQWTTLYSCQEYTWGAFGNALFLQALIINLSTYDTFATTVATASGKEPLSNAP
jgi:hypothetical protein